MASTPTGSRKLGESWEIYTEPGDIYRVRRYMYICTLDEATCDLHEINRLRLMQL